MKTPHSREIPANTPEKKVGQFQARELKRYPETTTHREVTLNRQMERKFSEKHLSSISEIARAREKKSQILEDMVKRDHPVSSDKQTDNVKDFHFTDKTEFEKELKKRDPGIPENKAGLIQGFHDTRDHQAFVKDQGDTLVTGLHEKLHQKSNCDLPTRMNEGITEHFARQEAGGIGNLKNIDRHGKEIPKPLSDYEKEVETVIKIEAIAGKEPIKKAYFEGRSDILENHFDSKKGKDSYQKLTEALEKRDYKTSSKIMERN